MKYCSKCKASAANHWSYCTKCGCYIGNDIGETDTEYECDKCKVSFFGGTFCPSCGTNVLDARNFLFGENAVDHKNLKVGMQVSIGSYFFHFRNNKIPLEWIILAKETGKVLLISKYAVDGRRYNGPTGCTWENSEIRDWLHTKFLDAAFTEEEKESIILTTQKCYGSPDCEDKIFLLSEAEFDFYISSTPLVKEVKHLACCYPTEYAELGGAKKGGRGTCQWWLRKNCKNEYDAVFINRNNFREKHVQPNIKMGIRPVIWVKTDE